MKILNALSLLFLAGTLSAQVGIGTTSPSEALDIETASASGTNLDINNTSTGDPTIQFQVSGTGIFTMGVDNDDSDKFKIGTTDVSTGTAITIDASQNVGVGNESPSAKLDVDGSAIFNESGTAVNFRVESDANLYMLFVDGTNNRVGVNNGAPGATLDVDGSAIFNESGDALDFRIESDNETHLFYVDGTNDVVGIGTSSPTYLLHIYNDGVATGCEPLVETNNTNWAGITYKNTNRAWFAGIPSGGASRFAIVDNTGAAEVISISTSGYLGVNNTSPGATLDVDGSAIFNESGGAVDFKIEGDTDTELFYVDGSADAVGIGTAIPGATLDVEGDLILLNGTNINEFSTDGTLSDNSDDAVPTEQAVKTYVDGEKASLTKTITIESPTNTDYFPIFRTDVAITVQEVIGMLNAAGDVDVTIYWDTDYAETSPTAVGTTTTLTTTSEATVDISSDATIPADSWIFIDIPEATTAQTLTISIRYTED